ncbi:hypothetical protein ACLB2K_062926 [Fragaria x ananassa]
MATYRALLSLKSSLNDPDSRLSALSALRLLNLSNNVFNRTFPPELSNLTNLRVLDLYNNNLTGVLPVSVATFHCCGTRIFVACRSHFGARTKLGKVTVCSKDSGWRRSSFDVGFWSKIRIWDLGSLFYLSLRVRQLRGHVDDGRRLMVVAMSDESQIGIRSIKRLLIDGGLRVTDGNHSKDTSSRRVAITALWFRPFQPSLVLRRLSSSSGGGVDWVCRVQVSLGLGLGSGYKWVWACCLGALINSTRAWAFVSRQIWI